MGDRLLYSDVLDTVRTSPLTADPDDADRERRHGEAVHLASAHLMLSLLTGWEPVLSQTQGFDSTVILGIAQEPKAAPPFRWLLENRRIRLRLFDSDTLVDTFANRLKDKAFLFSAWPEIDREVDRRELLDRVEARSTRGLYEPVARRLDALYDISAAHQTASSKIGEERARRPEVSLQQLIRWEWPTATGCRPRRSYADVLKALLEKRSNSRAELYEVLNGWHNQEDARLARQIVDVCYNRVIAKSLGNPKRLVTAEPVIAQDLYVTSKDDDRPKPLILAQASTNLGLERTSWEEIRDVLTNAKKPSEIVARAHKLRADGGIWAVVPTISKWSIGIATSMGTFVFGTMAEVTMEDLLPKAAMVGLASFSLTQANNWASGYITSLRSAKRGKVLQTYGALLESTMLRDDPSRGSDIPGRFS